MVARRPTGQLFKELRHRIAGGREPRIFWIERSPLLECVLVEQQQMQSLIGKQLVGFITLLELHRLVAYSQRAHLEPAKITIRRRARRGQLRRKE